MDPDFADDAAFKEFLGQLSYFSDRNVTKPSVKDRSVEILGNAYKLGMYAYIPSALAVHKKERNRLVIEYRILIKSLLYDRHGAETHKEQIAAVVKSILDVSMKIDQLSAFSAQANNNQKGSQAVNRRKAVLQKLETEDDERQYISLLANLRNINKEIRKHSSKVTEEYPIELPRSLSSGAPKKQPDTKPRTRKKPVKGGGIAIRQLERVKSLVLAQFTKKLKKN